MLMERSATSERGHQTATPESGSAVRATGGPAARFQGAGSLKGTGVGGTRSPPAVGPQNRAKVRLCARKILPQRRS